MTFMIKKIDMRTLGLILVAVFVMGCHSDNDEAFVYDIGFEFGVKDSEGNDLLNQENPNSIAENDIKLFYLVGDEMVEVYDGNLDYVWFPDP